MLGSKKKENAMRNYYGIDHIRGFVGEAEIIAFETRSARDQWVSNAERREAITRREAASLVRRDAAAPANFQVGNRRPLAGPEWLPNGATTFGKIKIN
jgi:hypothetical protein